MMMPVHDAAIVPGVIMVFRGQGYAGWVGMQVFLMNSNWDPERFRICYALWMTPSMGDEAVA